LLVEDEAPVRSGIRQVLELHGYHVIEADRAATALEAWDRVEGAIDLVLIDLVMPGGMDGGQLATSLTSRRPDVKFLFATGYSHARDTIDPALVLDKPVTVEQLISAVRGRLDANV
jgi:CheY-like chemotaxis protein